jgi:hypothetical protein
VKAIWITGFFCILTLVAYTAATVTLSDAGELQSEIPASRLDAAATDLSLYVYLHETRDAINVLEGAARAKICLE